jgi:hypothetical protein
MSSSARPDGVVMRDVIIVGGGCYGTFYAGQLAKARGRGKARFRRVIVVDRNAACRARAELGEAPDRTFVTRDWSVFFHEFLGSAGLGDDDFIVPSPHMPHLMFEWLLARARERWPGREMDVGPVPGHLGTPYDRMAPAPDGTRYVSFADWVCPTHCIEPAICPAIGSARTWEMGDAVRGLVARLRDSGVEVVGPALFVCRHHVFGVGTFAVDAVLAGDALVREAGESGTAVSVLIGTISSCHGALNMLRLGAVRPPLMTPAERQAILARARELFNSGEYWLAHEALETVWRSIISDGDEDAARVWQGLIQGAAALLHQERGNQHGVEVVGEAALEKLAGPQRSDIEFETVRFRTGLARALAGAGDPPRLEFRQSQGRRTDDG